MSTKSSIACGPNFHFYHEAFEQDAVYLELEQAFFEASPDKVTVAIPVVVWEVIRQYAGADLSWAAKSDEEIQQWVEHEVDKRIALCQTATASRSFFRMCGILTFGSVDDPRDMQLERGLAHCFEMRDKQRRLIAQVNELMSNQR
jgi:hypothetical protein